MKRIVIACVLLAGCSDSPTAPTPPTVPINNVPAVVVTPPVVTPPVMLPPFPPSDGRFDLTHYRQMVHNALEGRGLLERLRRQREAPRIYLRTIDDGGTAIDSATLNQTAAAIEATAGSLTGVFGVAGIERGTETREGQRGWITVRWSDRPEVGNDGRSSICGRGFIGGDLMILFPRSAGCRCGGGPAVSLSTVKHELGHVLGFWHTDSRDDLMYPFFRQCDLNPSAREIYHAALAYTQPIGSEAP